MKFRAHDTFFIRKGWLSKGMRNVKIEPAVFMGAKGNPMDILGIGANMVKALRYWLQAVKLTTEPNAGRREQSFTPFGEIVFKNDPYIEEMGTLWFLHYMLASNKDEATAWYFFYNEFKQSEFNKEDFVKQLSNYLSLIHILPPEEERPIGVWAQRRRQYLKQYHKILYYNLLTSGKLHSHLADVEEEAQLLFLRLVKEYAEKEGVTEQLKVKNPMEWVRRMNNIRERVNEVVNTEMIFT